MKRQHPDNPELFWCPKCEGYKARGEFGNKKSDPNGIASYCVKCRKLMFKNSYIPIGGRIKDRKHPIEKHMYWCPQCKTYKSTEEYYKIRRGCGVANECKNCHNQRNPEYYQRKETQDRIKKYFNKPEIIIKEKNRSKLRLVDGAEKVRRKSYKKKIIQEIPDWYAKQQLKGGAVSIETIDLKREQLLLHRELKQLKGELSDGTTGERDLRAKKSA